VVAAVGQVDDIENAFEPLFVTFGVFAVDDERQQDVFLGGQGRQQVEKLEDKPNVVSPGEGGLVFVHLGELFFAQRNFPFGGCIQPAQQVQQGRFAAARRPHDGDKFAFFHFEIDPGQCFDRVLTEFVMFFDKIGFENRHNRSIQTA